MQITRVDPMDVDLDLADRPRGARPRLPCPRRARDPAAHRAGAAHLLPARQRRPPVDALWVASDGGEEIGWLLADLPWRDNLGMAGLRGLVHPDHRRRGVGGRLLDEALALHRRARPDRPPLRSVPAAPTASRSSRATASPTPASTSTRSAGSTCTRRRALGPAPRRGRRRRHRLRAAPRRRADARRAAGRDGRPARGDQRRARRRGQGARRLGRRPAARVRRGHGPAPADDVPRPGPARGRPASWPG